MIIIIIAITKCWSSCHCNDHYDSTFSSSLTKTLTIVSWNFLWKSFHVEYWNGSYLEKFSRHLKKEMWKRWGRGVRLVFEVFGYLGINQTYAARIFMIGCILEGRAGFGGVLLVTFLSFPFHFFLPFPPQFYYYKKKNKRKKKTYHSREKKMV